MAWLELDRSGNFHVSFRLGDRRFKRSLKTPNRKEAERLVGRLEENLLLAERGRLTIPDGADAVTFLLSDGKVAAKLQIQPAMTLRQAIDAFFGNLPPGSLEASTQQGMRSHCSHLLRQVGASFVLQQLGVQDLQNYIEKRSDAHGIRGRRVAARTIQKEIVTLRTVWNWAVKTGRLSGRFPNQGLMYPKGKEKPPFQTIDQIQRRMARGGMSYADEADLWDCAFLTLPEVADLLDHVQRYARYPFVFAMFAFAAHTGARRSELLRSKVADIDLDSGIITIHERKRDHSKSTTRRVPISPYLTQVLRDWLSIHRGGELTFCKPATLTNGHVARGEIGAISTDEAHDHFKRALVGSKWVKLRGWHVFRHSFCSNCAAAGIDQRVINARVGHQTEDMVRRYRHLIPNQEQLAIQTVFGNGQQSVVPNPQ